MHQDCMKTICPRNPNDLAGFPMCWFWLPRFRTYDVWEFLFCFIFVLFCFVFNLAPSIQLRVTHFLKEILHGPILWQLKIDTCHTQLLCAIEELISYQKIHKRTNKNTLAVG